MLKDHIPRFETLFRLADFFAVSRERVLRLAGYLPYADDYHSEAWTRDDEHVAALLAAFHDAPSGVTLTWRSPSSARSALFPLPSTATCSARYTSGAA